MLLVLFALLSCASDVSIMKRYEEPVDSAVTQVDTNQEVSETGVDDTQETQQDLSRIIGLAEIHFRQIACPACVGEAGEFDITATLKLHYPTTGDYFDHLTPVDQCSTSIYNTYVSSQPLDASQPASFNGIQLQPSGPGEWTNNYIYEYEYIRNTQHAVTTQHGVIQDAFQTVEGFDSINPYTLLWVDPSYAFEPVISKSSTTFTWAPVLPNDYFEIIVAVYSPDGSQFLGAVSCMQRDTGVMVIPGNYFASYPYFSLAAVHFIRHRTGSAVTQDLGGTLQTHMLWEVVGTAHVE